MHGDLKNGFKLILLDEFEDYQIQMAEAVRFELTEGYQPSTVFKTVALNRSATLPSLKMRIIDD